MKNNTVSDSCVHLMIGSVRATFRSRPPAPLPSLPSGGRGKSPRETCRRMLPPILVSSEEGLEPSGGVFHRRRLEWCLVINRREWVAAAAGCLRLPQRRARCGGAWIVHVCLHLLLRGQLDGGTDGNNGSGSRSGSRWSGSSLGEHGRFLDSPHRLLLVAS